MIDYIYDGTFDGLLTVIWHHYYTDRAARICAAAKGSSRSEGHSESEGRGGSEGYGGYREIDGEGTSDTYEGLTEAYQPSFLQESMIVTTDPEKADRVYQAIRNKISEYDLRGVYRAWLSCDPEKEMKILRYVVLGFREGHRTSSLHSDPIVSEFQEILKKISRESERMLQFVRFSVVRLSGDSVPADLSGDSAGANLPANSVAAGTREVLYARIEPDNDVIELAAPHFCDRFRNERLIIHDIGRDKAVIAYHGRWIISAFMNEDAPAPSAEELQYRRLWKKYFDHIAIMERKNTRCQNNFIPDRYRKHLTEIVTAEQGGECP